MGILNPVVVNAKNNLLELNPGQKPPVFDLVIVVNEVLYLIGTERDDREWNAPPQVLMKTAVSFFVLALLVTLYLLANIVEPVVQNLQLFPVLQPILSQRFTIGCLGRILQMEVSSFKGTGLCTLIFILL